MNKKGILLLFLAITVAFLAAGAVSASDPISGNSTVNVTTDNSSSSPPPDPIISGTVTDANGNTVDGAIISVYDLSDVMITSGTTDSYGNYRVSFISGDTFYKVMASYPGYVSPINEVEVYLNPYDGLFYGYTDFQLNKYVYVDGTNGDNSYDGTSPYYYGGFTGPKATIQSGLDAAGDGCTVQILNGSYTENLIINHNIKLEPFLNGGSYDAVEIYPNIITDPTITVNAGSQIRYLTIYGSQDSGIDLNSIGSYIYSNNIYSGECGINMDNSSGNVVNNNWIHSGMDGIRMVNNSNGNLITNNYIDQNWEAIAINSTYYNVIQENIIENNQNGITINDSSHISILSNNINYNSNYGIYYSGTFTDNIVSYNRFYANGSGSSGIVNDGSDVDATNNWWGTNDDPLAFIGGSGIINVYPYIMLRADSDSYNVSTGGVTTVNANLTINSSDQDTSLSGYYIPIVPITFSTSLGNFPSGNPFTTDLFYGYASTEFDAEYTPGYATINVQVDDATVQLYWGDIEISDTTSPSVSITTPNDGDVVSDAVNIMADASDDVGVDHVDFSTSSGDTYTDWNGLDGWTWDWEISSLPDGYYYLTATAYDAAGNWSDYTISVTVDNYSPTIDITNPSDGDNVNGSVDITTNPNDDAGISYVDFFIDSVYYSTDSYGFDGWSCSWDTTGFSDGPHTITATAYDLIGHSTSDSINVNVDNTAPEVTINPVSDNYNHEIDVDFTTEPGATVQYSINGGPWTDYSDMIHLTDGTYNITYHAIDWLGNTSTDQTTSYTIDTIPPTVNTNPSGDNYNYEIDVGFNTEPTATVQYSLNGGPWTNYINPLHLTDGTWTITYHAIDWLGNTSTDQTDNYTIDTIAPTVNTTPAGGNYNTTIDVGFNTEPTATVQYSLNGGPWTGYINPLHLTDGTWTITYHAIDWLGNTSTDQTTSYTIDTIPPTVNTIPAGGNYNHDVYVDFIYEDGDTIEYSLDGGTTWDSYYDPIHLMDGTWTITYYAIDWLGNISTEQSENYTIDTIAPIVSHSPEDSNYNTEINVELTSDDPAATIQYSLNGGPWTGYINPLHLTDGTWTITYHAIDWLGNTSTDQTTSYTIDTIAPTVNTNPSGDNYNYEIDVGFNTEPTATVQYSLNGGPWTPYSDMIHLTNGTWTITYHAIDWLGNTSTNQTATYTIDTTPPIVNANPAGGNYNTNIDVGFNTEPTATVQYSLNGGSWTNYINPIHLTDGNYILIYHAIDWLGNTSTDSMASYIIDTIPPNVNINPVSGTYSSDIDVSIISEPGANIQYSQNGGPWINYTIPIHLTNGIFTIIYHATDLAGNTSIDQTNNYIITALPADTTPPTVNVNPPSGTYNYPIDVTLSSEPGATIQYSQNGGPLTLYTGSITLNTNGTYIITYQATDLAGNTSTLQTATYTINIPPADTTPPTVNVNPPSGTYNYPIDVTLSSEPGANIQYSQNGGPWTNYLTSIHLTSGTYTITYHATDLAGNTSIDQTNNYTIITAPTDTTPPIVTASPGYGTYYAGQDVILTSNELVNYIIYSLNGGAWTNYTLPIHLITNGVYNLSYQAQDLVGNISPVQSVNYTIVSNVPPVLDQIGNKTVYSGQSLVFSISGSDAYGDPLTFSASNLPTAATFNPSTRTFTWIPAEKQLGVFSGLIFLVTDGVSIDYEIINITVKPDTAPVLDIIGNKNVNVNETLTFNVNGSDANGDPLTYNAIGLPLGATFINGKFTWTPGFADRGTYTIKFNVSDGILIDAETIRIKVNGPPVLAPISNMTVNENDTLSFQIKGTDLDGDTLSYSSSVLPSGANLDPVTGIFTWTPGYNQSGVYAITFTVSDGSLTNSKTANITVKDVPIYENVIKVTNNGTGLVYVNYTITITETNGKVTNKTVTGYINPGASINSSFGQYPSGTKINIVELIYNKTSAYRTVNVDNYIYINGVQFFHQNVYKTNVTPSPGSVFINPVKI